jgi:hypothetical protein
MRTKIHKLRKGEGSYDIGKIADILINLIVITVILIVIANN